MKTRFITVCLIFMTMCGFQVVPGDKPKPDQPNNERQAQSSLPQSKSPLWNKLVKCQVNYNQHTGLYSIMLTDEVKAMGEQTFDVNGFMLPLDGGDQTKHFLLAKRTPVCLFCPPGEPNEIIEVRSKKALDWVDEPITVKGKFKLVNDAEKGVFFLMEDAELMSHKN